MEHNLLISGDNLLGLEYLLNSAEMRGRVALIYADPPYGTKQVFTVSENRRATISRAKNGGVAYSDKMAKKEYLEFLGRRLELMRELLREDGSIYLHIDLKMGHYVKCLMDDIFGEKNFINDITRVKCNPKNFRRSGYGNVKDVILFYAKNKNFVWNNPREKIDTENDPRFNKVDEDRRAYTTTPLHAPGETENGPTGRIWRGLYPPAGRHWRYPPEELERLDKAGLIEWSSTGNPRKKIYADEVKRNGVKVQDIWVFKDPQNAIYPTAKNLELLKLIIRASSNEGDIVLDPFCGSGTTLVAADELGRPWLGIDSSEIAIDVCVARLEGFLLLDIKEDKKLEEAVVKSESVGDRDRKISKTERLLRPPL